MILAGAFILVTTLHVSTGASFSKEFLSADRDAVRSVEPSSDLELKIGGRGLDVGKALCENYHGWSGWSSCNRKCEQTRVRRCAKRKECGRTWVKEKRACVRKRGPCIPLSYKVIGIQKKNRMIEELLYDLLYDPWTPWSRCTRTCKQQRTRKCKYSPICDDSYIQEERRCVVKGAKCHNRFSLKPLATGRKKIIHFALVDNNSSSNSSNSSNDADNNNSTSNFTDIENNIKHPEEQVVDNSKDEEGNDVIDAGKIVSILGKDEVKRGSRKPRWQRKKKERNKKRGVKGRGRKNKIKELASAQRNCGIRKWAFRGSYKVLGGREVVKHSWPWQVAIMSRDREQYCGGTLIAEKWVLTAAHCVRKKGRRRRLFVRVGEHDIEMYENTRQDIRPEKEFPHPDFDYHTITNDIALIKLRHPPAAFTVSGYACLPDVNYSPSRGQLCTVVGWGKLKSTHIHGASALHEADIPVVKHKKCQRSVQYAITPAQVCAGFKRGGIDSCAGDSGGPLLCKDKNNRYILYGVTSYGEGCGLKGKYGIYSKVTSYLQWINKTISENR